MFVPWDPETEQAHPSGPYLDVGSCNGF